VQILLVHVTQLYHNAWHKKLKILPSVTHIDLILSLTQFSLTPNSTHSLHWVHFSCYQYWQNVISILSMIILTSKQYAKCVSNPMLQSIEVKTLSLISNGNNATDLWNNVTDLCNNTTDLCNNANDLWNNAIDP
jgi:hypothetical protein